MDIFARGSGIADIEEAIPFLLFATNFERADRNQFNVAFEFCKEHWK